MIRQIDLLVHPFYTISKIFLKNNISPTSEQNLLQMRDLWHGAIEKVRMDEEGLLILVNSLEDIPDATHPLENPYRALYKQTLLAGEALENRYVCFTPSVPELPFEVIDKGKYSTACSDALSFDFIRGELRLYAYGEHIHPEKDIGCVNASAASIAASLGIGNKDIVIDPTKSLSLLDWYWDKGNRVFVDSLYVPADRFMSR